MLQADYLINEILPSGAMIKIVNDRTGNVIYQGKAGEAVLEQNGSYNVWVVKKIAFFEIFDEQTKTHYPNALEITVG